MKTLRLTACFFLIYCLIGQVDKATLEALQWAHYVIKPFFLSDDLTRVEPWFTPQAWKEALMIRNQLKVTHFGQIELEQQATINDIPAWRFLVNITAYRLHDKTPSKFNIHMLILRNKNGFYKINHIDELEVKQE